MALLKFWGAETGNINEMTQPASGLITEATASTSSGGSRSFKNDGSITAASNFEGTGTYTASQYYITFRIRIDSATAPAANFGCYPLQLFDNAGTPVLMTRIGFVHDTFNRLFLQVVDTSNNLLINSNVS